MNIVKTYNCIVVLNRDKSEALFCVRKKDPYKGRYNFVGGKVETGEESEAAAYRELEEETGLTRRQICLYRLMDIRYYQLEFILEIYVGILEEDTELQEENNPLIWLPLTEDFTDKAKFAGEQNIAHIINVALQYPIPDRYYTQDGFYIGVDGCRNGWIAAVLDHGDLRLERYESIEALICRYPDFDSFLIDMAIGLRDNADQIRPEQAAREELGRKASSVFPIPSRSAVYAETEEEQKQANIKAFGKSLAKQSLAILPKIRELDLFLSSHPEYQNRILESHPELAFTRMKGSEVICNKKNYPGFTEREWILSEYLGRKHLSYFYDEAKELQCKPDDMMDAVCLAVTGALYAHGLCETIPANPERDAHGLEMKMTVPKKVLQ